VHDLFVLSLLILSLGDEEEGWSVRSAFYTCLRRLYPPKSTLMLASITMCAERILDSLVDGSHTVTTCIKAFILH
jgi:hypothetical protein